MLSFRQQLTLRQNLYWAWDKAKHFYRCGDIWFDEAEVASFEANLEMEVDTIIKQFAALRYRMSSIRPVAHPKRLSEEGKLGARQAFSISVRDQVAWIAFVNVVGPNLDSQMPPWSYGNRLFRSVWFEEGAAGQEILRVGWYRHSSGQLYRKFHQSWPVFHRHVFLTIREIPRPTRKFELDEADERVLVAEKTLSSKLRLPYLKRDYWEKPGTNVYWASIDLKKFYPSVATDLILRNLTNHSGFPPSEVNRLAKQLLKFPLDLRDWNEDELLQLDLQDKPRVFPRIPTGLFVAGFLANVALLEVDQLLTKRLNGRIAHFRYVDDHIILATDFKELVEWLEEYRSLLKALPGEIAFNPDKAHPDQMAKLLKARQEDPSLELSETTDSFKLAKNASRLDPKFPAPLMTQTLGLVSDIARTDFDRLDDREQRHILDDLEHLLLTEFPDKELREDTRIAFAATMISRLAPRCTPNVEALARLKRAVFSLQKELHAARQAELDINATEETSAPAPEAAIKKNARLNRLRQRLKATQEQFDEVSKHEHDRIFGLLLKALHEHPEKLRLWTRVLDYCRRVGYRDLGSLRDELQRLAHDSPVVAPYLRALVWQVMADHVFECVKTIRSQTSSDLWKQVSWRYLQAAVHFFTGFHTPQPFRFYEKSAAQLLQCALGSVSQVLQRAEDWQFPSRKELNTFRIACRKVGAIGWGTHPEVWARKTAQSLPVWLWLAETKASPKLSTEPTPIWLRAAEKLNPQDSASWAVWARYPRHLPPELLKHLENPTREARRYYLSRSDSGWLYEVLTSLRSKKIELTPRLQAIAAGVLQATITPAKVIGLDEWAAWTRSRAEKNPHDPRVSEWTALNIVNHLALMLSDVTRIAAHQPIHPANFFVPRSWQEQNEDPLTWERWHSKINTKGALTFRRAFCVQDSRFCRVSTIEKHIEVEQEPVRGLGLLLLGLLRRSFEWPATWNPRGHQQAWANIAKTLTSTVPCSSWTTAIIEACVVPRVRETLLFPLLHDELATDTRFDPPRIDSLLELRSALSIAAKVLEQYQLSVLNHEPRQLVPVSIKQLTRPNWQEDFDIQPLD